MFTDKKQQTTVRVRLASRIHINCTQVVSASAVQNNEISKYNNISMTGGNSLNAISHCIIQLQKQVTLHLVQYALSLTLLCMNC